MHPPVSSLSSPILHKQKAPWTKPTASRHPRTSPTLHPPRGKLSAPNCLPTASRAPSHASELHPVDEATECVGAAAPSCANSPLSPRQRPSSPASGSVARGRIDTTTTPPGTRHAVLRRRAAHCTRCSIALAPSSLLCCHTTHWTLSSFLSSSYSSADRHLAYISSPALPQAPAPQFCPSRTPRLQAGGEGRSASRKGRWLSHRKGRARAMLGGARGSAVIRHAAALSSCVHSPISPP